jgi:hypothetical protein
MAIINQDLSFVCFSMTFNWKMCPCVCAYTDVCINNSKGTGKFIPSIHNKV